MRKPKEDYCLKKSSKKKKEEEKKHLLMWKDFLQYKEQFQ